MSVIPPITVYHVASMGNWREVIREQFFRLRRCGLAEALSKMNDSVRLTHVGVGLAEVLQEASMQDVPVTVAQSDPNTDHYETFAMLEIERLIKKEGESRPVLYFHTKGVSNPGSAIHKQWREVMHIFVLDNWRHNLDILKERDAVGFNFWNHGNEHFSGNFWMANSSWIAQLPDFVSYHHSKNLVRYSCELWIGSGTKRRCNAYTYGTMNAVTWTGNFDFSPFLHKPPDCRVTFLSAATEDYVDDLTRLQRSFRLLSSTFEIRTAILAGRHPWKHYYKLDTARDLLRSCATDYAIWIDADCEFLCPLLQEDLIDSSKKFMAVRHFAYDDPHSILPNDAKQRLSASARHYWQACLWGGRKDDVAALVDKLEWIKNTERGYDEHGINVELNAIPDDVYTLPCRYASPSSFSSMPDYERSYKDRSGGPARILHHNREISR